MNLLNHLSFKIFSVVLAFIFWFFLVTFQNIISDINTPLKLEVLNKPVGMDIPYDLPGIYVKVTAPKDEVGFLKSDDFRAFIDLKDLEEGESFVDVHVTTNRNNINIVSYMPDQVAISLEELRTKSLQVEYEIQGVPDSDYTVGIPSSTLSEVIISGPKTLVDKVNKIKYLISLKGDEVESINGVYKLNAYDIEGTIIEHGITINPSSIESQLNIFNAYKEKSIPVRLNFADDVDVKGIEFSSTTPKNIIVRMPFKEALAVSFIDTEDLTLEMVDKILNGEEIEVGLVLQDGHTIVSGEKTVKVTLR